VALVVEPVVPTAVDPLVRPAVAPAPRVLSPAPARAVVPDAPASLRAPAPVFARAVSLTGTHGSTLALGPLGPGCVAPVGEPGWRAPDCVVPAAPGDVTPDVPVCVGLVDDGLVLCAWSGTISAAVSSAPPADNANFAFTWTFLSVV
jgi:hypothetical protein